MSNRYLTDEGFEIQGIGKVKLVDSDPDVVLEIGGWGMRFNRWNLSEVVRVAQTLDYLRDTSNKDAPCREVYEHLSLYVRNCYLPIVD